jgi:hypothetical protein
MSKARGVSKKYWEAMRRSSYLWRMGIVELYRERALGGVN